MRRRDTRRDTWSYGSNSRNPDGLAAKWTALERWFDGGVGRLHCLVWDSDTGLKWAELLSAASEKRDSHAGQRQPDRGDRGGS